MTIGGSLALIAVGAILKWAVTAHVSWLDLQTTGTVLFVVGLVGLAVSLAYTFWWASGSRPQEEESTRVMRQPPNYR
jgi:hypothetical protein